ncbi:thiamine pyrophosphate-dependent dehydrogenase E1 component subunit alpha [bacterium]|nr:thiamine pyrophosphate-dependent dehydrogenase E1 component subunit alpha [bacterium]
MPMLDSQDLHGFKPSGDAQQPQELATHGLIHSLLTKQDLLNLYHYLVLTRTLEDKIHYICSHQNPKNPLIIGKGYLSTGQEAVSIGAAYTLKENDWVAQSHRDFGCLLMRGLTVDDLLMQYFSKVDGPTKGRDANVHLGNTQKRILGFISHMGAMLPAANGVAWASKYKGENNVTLAFFGDGASSQGAVHEAMNYAAVFKLPVVFICNNNGWAISTPTHQQYAIQDISARASAYGMPGSTCDGNNVVEVYNHLKKAVDHARNGNGPSLVECKTMRMAGHGTHDRAQYMPKDQIEYWKSRDPISNFEQRLINNGVADDFLFKNKKEELAQLVNEAVERISQMPGPTVDKQLDDVFAK